MVEIFLMKSGTRVLQKCDEVEEQCWINLENPSDFEIEQISKQTKIPEDMIKVALDEEERAHMESEDGNTLIVIDVPIISEENNNWYNYSTLPLGIIYNDKYFVTVSIRSNAVITDFISNRIKQFDVNKRTRFIYQILYVNAIKFLHYLKQIDRTSSRVQQALHRSMKNKELIQLLDLEKSLVYFSTSLNSNQAVIERIKQTSAIKHYEDDNDILDDVIIENKQAIEMATIYRDIMSGTMDAFASVISNNQNIVMKLLTAITILLTIPTVIASLWGMNVLVPFGNSDYGFWIVFSIIVAIIVLIFIIMFRKKMF